MQKYFDKYKSEIILGCVVMLTLGIVLFFIVPNIQLILDEKRETETIKQKNEVLATKLEALGKLETPDLEEKYKLLARVVLKDKNPYLVFTAIDNFLAGISDKDIAIGKLEFSPGEVKDEKAKLKDTQNLNLDFPIQGKFQTILELVRLIESEYPLMSLSGITGAFNDNSQADLKLKVLIYVVPEATQIPSLETPIIGFSDSEKTLFDDLMRLAATEGEKSYVPQRFDRKDIFQ